MSTMISQLQAARDSLTPETWTKGTYFDKRALGSAGNSITCFCAHGALHLQVNQDVKTAYDSGAEPRWLRLIMGSLPIKIAYKAYYCLDLDPLGQNNDEKYLEAWRLRPLHEKYGDAHYLLGMVGLTSTFNDSPSTTLGMVKTKFDEAIALAKRLEL